MDDHYESCDCDTDESPAEQRRRREAQRKQEERDRNNEIHHLLNRLCKLLRHDKWKACQL